ncbi:MAG: carbohydrate porin [Polyangiaceae bacterium]
MARLEKLLSGFAFASYGRMIVGGDLQGRPGRNTDFVSRGSRLDESNYAELELRRIDDWGKTGSRTRIVTSLALGNPIFHYSGDFSTSIAIRNLFIEGRDLGVKRLSLWAGSRTYRGDDVYVLDFWPLDDLNTLGAGARYQIDDKGWTWVALHTGINRPNGLFFYQTSPRAGPLGPTTVEILNRQRTVGSLKLHHIFPVGAKGGVKSLLYGEVHALSAGERETEAEAFEQVPAENGFVLGAEVGGFTGERGIHLNVFFRYAHGLAAYGELGMPAQLGLDQTTAAASEVRLAFGGNYEGDRFGLLAGGYLRSFRNASPALDGDDVDEGVLVVRPHLFLGDRGGIAVEGSFQAQRRGTALSPETEPGKEVRGTMWRFGVIPFLSPAGRGSLSRPQFRMIYVVSVRDRGARGLYAKDDVFGARDVEHFLGLGAEWWFDLSGDSW